MIDRFRCAHLVSLLVVAALAAASLVHASALPDPAAAKAADKCQKAITKAGAKFSTKTLKSLEKCYDALFKCIQTKPGDQKCIDKVLAKCADAVDTKAPKERAKLLSSIAKKCESFADVSSADGLFYDDLGSACENDYGVPLTDVASVGECIRRQHECHAERMFNYEMARAGQIASALGVSQRGGSCLEDLGGMGHVGDPKGLGKALDKCQKAFKKAGAKFVAAKLKSLAKCTTTLFGCVQKKPGDPKCTAKAQKTCDKELGSKIPKAEMKLASSIEKRCGEIFAQLGAGEAMGTAALEVPCRDFGVATLATFEDLARCLVRQHECAVEEIFRFQAPRAATLLPTVGHELRTDFCAAPGEVLLVVTNVGSGTGTVTFQPSGDTCESPCAKAVPIGTFVTLEARTANGDDSYFQGFDGGGCVGAARDCQIQVNDLTFVNATFNAQTHNLVFVTSTSHATDLGGATAYDQVCNDIATDTGINNLAGDAFVAWTSDSSSLATTRLGAARGFIRLDGRPFADTIAGLTGANVVLNPPMINETGVASSNFSMTGTFPSGAAGITCTDWTGVGTLTVGAPAAGPGEWSTRFTAGCADPRSLYCLMNTKTAALAAAPASGKRIFLTNAPYLPGNDADAQCEADKPAGTGTVVALLADTGQAASALLGAGTTYVRPDGQIVGTGQQLIDASASTDLLESGIWQHGDGTYASVTTGVWTGSLELTDVPVADTCDDWTLTTGMGLRASRTVRIDGTFWGGTAVACTDTTLHAYCVEQ